MRRAWPLYRLWLNDKLMLTEFDMVSIDDVDLACSALDAWEEAQAS